jgi:hypothetical protein
MRRLADDATSGPVIAIFCLALVAGLLMGSGLAPVGMAACAFAALLGVGLARRTLPFSQRAKYQRRHLRLAGPRPGARLG